MMMVNWETKKCMQNMVLGFSQMALSLMLKVVFGVLVSLVIE